MMASLWRKQLVNLALVGVAIALLVTVIVTTGSVTTSEKEARSFNVLAAFRDGEVSRITVEKGDKTLRLERIGGAGETDGGGADEGTWFIKQPFDEEADVFAIQRLLGTLQYASFLRQIKPEEVDRAAFGLDDPVLVVEAQMGDITYRLRAGKEAASPAGARYLEVTGEGAPRKGVVLIGKSLMDELSVGADDFRGRYIMPYLSSSLAAFQIASDGAVRKFWRAPWDGFEVELDGRRVRTNRQALDRVLVQFARTNADKFIDADAAAKALSDAKDRVVVTMTPRDEKKLPVGRVELGGKCPEGEGIVALRTAPDKIAGCVPENVLLGLTIPAGALLDRSLFWMRRDEVESLEVSDGEKKLVLDRKEDGFVLREPFKGEVDGEAGNGRLDAILRATGPVVDAPDLEKLGLKDAPGRITVKSAAAHEDDVKTETVTVSAPAADGSVYARREQDGVVLSLGREAARALRPDASLVRSRHVYDYDADEVTRVATEGPTPQEFTRDMHGGITLVKPSGYVGDGALATEVIDALRTLTADRWVSDRDDGSFGFDKPTLRARFWTKKNDDTKEHQLTLGGPTTSGFYAKVDDEPGVFVVPRRVHEVLTTWLMDRSVFMLDPTIVRRVTLSTPENKVVLEKQGEQFVQSGGASQLPAAAIQRVIDALSVLRAEAAVSVGPEKPEYGLARPLLSVRVEREPGAAATEMKEWAVGAGDSFRGISIHYARLTGVSGDQNDATYAIPRSVVQQIIDAL